MSKLIETLASLDQLGQPFVVVTLAEAIGSTPQDTGAKMLVDRTGRVFGTVGGGRVEHKAIEAAQQLIRARGPRAVLCEWNLQTDVGMTCGGLVKVLFETMNVQHWHIVLFGAGHVAQALVRTLVQLDCHVTCIDPRDEWLSQLPTSDKLTTHRIDEPADYVAQLRDDDFVICMTMGHRTDRPILETIFRTRRSFPFLGVIGSHAKRKVLCRELQEAGIAAETADRFECPIGLPLGNNQPYEIAISIVAQLLQYRDREASLTG